jgi:hypothetical protein
VVLVSVVDVVESVVLDVVDVVDVVVVHRGLDTLMKMVFNKLSWPANCVVYKDRAEVLGNRERDVDESRPRGRGRAARGSGSGRGREFDRHSATGRVYLYNCILLLMI